MLTNNRSMKRAIAALCVATLACSAVGCGEEKKEAIPTFSNATYIAQMATLKCYYHNTAKLSHEGSWFFNNGYKRMWMEYSGIVKYGIDADKVTISPDANGHKVIITVPPAHVLDDPDVNEKSFSKPLVSTGFATSITAEEKTEMFDKAQQSMLKQAKTDSALLAQAEARARTILEQYVRNVLGDDAKNWTIASVRSAAIVGCVVPQEIMIERCESSCLTMSTSQGLRAVCVQSGCVVRICTTSRCVRSGIWQ